MKKLIFILILCIALSPACLGEEEPKSSADEFLDNLSKTWDSFVNMANDAGQSVSDWADKNGVTEWAQGAVDDLTAWAQESGLTDWADATLKDITAWFDESGVAEWTAETSKNVQTFVEENKPAIEAWLNAAGEEVAHAWDTLVNADQHTRQEVEEAYQVVTESLEDATGK